MAISNWLREPKRSFPLDCAIPWLVRTIDARGLTKPQRASLFNKKQSDGAHHGTMDDIPHRAAGSSIRNHLDGVQQMTKSINDYTAEELNRISDALWPSEIEDVDQKAVTDSITKMIRGLQSTADYVPALDMVQWSMSQALTDMAYNKGRYTSDKLAQVGQQLAESSREADGTEIFAQKVDKLMWRKRQLELQLQYWRFFFKAARDEYRRTTMLLQQEGSYDFLPADWEAPEKRAAHWRRVNAEKAQANGLLALAGANG